MSSGHNAMAALFGVPTLLEHFAERDANGNYEPIQYLAYKATTWLSWPAIVSQIRFQMDANERGDIRRIETRTVQIDRAVMEDGGITGFEKKARVRIGETEWALREDESVFAETLVTLGLVRIPLVEQGGQRGEV